MQREISWNGDLYVTHVASDQEKVETELLDQFLYVTYSEKYSWSPYLESRIIIEVESNDVAGVRACQDKRLEVRECIKQKNVLFLFEYLCICECEFVPLTRLSGSTREPIVFCISFLQYTVIRNEQL